MNVKNVTKGFTLLEVTIYLAFLGLFTTLMSSVLYFFIAKSSDTSSEILRDQDLNFISHKIEYEIDHAESIIYPTSSTSSLLIYTSASNHNENKFLLSSSGIVEIVSGGISYQLTNRTTTFSSMIFDFSSSGTISVTFLTNNKVSTFLYLRPKNL